MEEFLRIALSFPTVVFSIALAVLMLLWLVTALGIFELDAMDNWALPDMDAFEPAGLAGLLLKVGLGGVPLMVVLTVLALLSWVLSYFVQFLLINPIPLGILRIPLGVVAMLVVFVIGVLATGIVLRPFRRMMAKLAPQAPRSIIGMAAVVRSATVTSSFGQGSVEDGGAGLILHLRSDRDPPFRRGDRVVLIEYLQAENAYRVIGEDEFHGR